MAVDQVALEKASTEKVNFEWVKLELIKKVGNDTITLDLLPVLLGISLYEDIFKKLVAGMLSFIDKDKLFSKFPVNGNEIVNFHVRSMFSESSIVKTFEVISGAPAPQGTSTEQGITLELVDPNYKKFIKEYSTSFKDKSISEFVKDFTNSAMGITLKEVDATEGTKAYAFPYQRFHFMLAYLNKYAVSKKGYKYYLFYSTLFGSYYKTISGLFENEAIEVFTETLPNYADMNRNFFSNYTLNNNFNLQDMMLNNGFGTQYQWLDMDTKEIATTEYKYSTLLDNEITLGTCARFNNTNEDGLKSVSCSAGDPEQRGNLTVLDNILRNSLNISITFSSPIIERTCGNVCKLIFKDYSSRNDRLNIDMSGYYLIKSINHVYTKSNYVQYINFIRNGDLQVTNPEQFVIPMKLRGLSGQQKLG